MGGWKKTMLAAYLVTWPDGVIKAGVSERQRWRRFCLRGGSLEAVTYDDSMDRVMQLERTLLAELMSSLPWAFESIRDASAHLGQDGGGYAECFRASTEKDFTDARDACIRIMQTHHADASETSHARAHARTYGRTYEQETAAYATSKSFSSSTHARVPNLIDSSSTEGATA